jgi:DNA-binding NarL/FixJ family response regulator
MTGRSSDQTQRGARAQDRDPLRLLIVDRDEEAMRVIVSHLVQKGFDVVGPATTDERAIDLAEKLTPDVILMDIDMPAEKAIAATATLRARMPSTGVVGFGFSKNRDLIGEMLRAGASHYLPKAGVFMEAAAAIRVAASRSNGP